VRPGREWDAEAGEWRDREEASPQRRPQRQEAARPAAKRSRATRAAAGRDTRAAQRAPPPARTTRARPAAAAPAAAASGSEGSGGASGGAGDPDADDSDVIVLDGSDEEGDETEEEASESDEDFQRDQPRRQPVRVRRPARPAAPPPRRSGRERRGTTVRVGGYTVLRANNYTLRGGEPSVYDKELRGSDDESEEHDDTPDKRRAQPRRAAARRRGASGDESGSGGSDEDDEDEESDDDDDDSSEDSRRGKRRRLAAASAAAEAARSKRGARARTTVESVRGAHNAAVLAEVAAVAPRRAAFFAKHLKVLLPFLPPAVATKLRADGAASAALPAAEQKEHAAAVAAAHAAELPPQVKAQLRPHQLEGFRFLYSGYVRGLNPILGDEMGLGKTLQTICLLAQLTLNEEPGGGPHLVVCPMSVLHSWQQELKRWCPSLRVVMCHVSVAGTKEKLAELADPSSFDVCVTSYEMVKSTRFAQALQHRIMWRCLVLDEAQRAKSDSAQISAALRGVRRRCCVMLTGTLLQNDLHELWALLNLIYPDVFTDSTPFDEAFNLNVAKGKSAKVDPAKLRDAYRMLRPLCLRREKADVELSLTAKVETRVGCPLSAPQTALYRAFLMRHSAIIDQLTSSDPHTAALKRVGDLKLLRNLVMQLRMICGHPYLLDAGCPADDYEPPLAEFVAASGKLKVLDRLMQRLHAGGHRVVLFSQFTSMLDLIEDYVKQRNYAYARLDGSTARARRAVDQLLFNRPGSPLFCFLLSTRAGGLGINLQSADTVILFDSDWNPQVDAQAMARVHRIGQTKPVAVFRLVTSGSIEERILQRAEKKLYLDAVVAKGEGLEADAEDADEDESEDETGAPGGAAALAATLRIGADAIFKAAEGEEPSEEELDALCDRTPAGAERRAAMEGLKAAEGVTHADMEGAPPALSTYTLNGQNLEEQALAGRAEAEKGRKQSEVLEGKRQRVATTVMVDGFAIKTGNTYAMGDGEPSIWEREATRKGGADEADEISPKLLRAAFAHSGGCQVCWDGGELYCCHSCPAAYHANCASMSATVLRRTPAWRCPQHYCMVCDRPASAVGGLIFRCQSCPNAFCDEHLPESVVQHGRIVGTCARFSALGWRGDKANIFIHCDEECADFAAGGFEGWLEEAGAEPPPVWVRAGDDKLRLPLRAGDPGVVPLVQASFFALRQYLETVYERKHQIRVTGGMKDVMVALTDLRQMDGDDTFAALYAEARAAMLRNAPLKLSLRPKPPPPPRPEPLARAVLYGAPGMPAAPPSDDDVPEMLRPLDGGAASESESYEDDDDEFAPDYEGIEFVAAYAPPPPELAAALASPARASLPATQPPHATPPGPSIVARAHAWLSGADVAPAPQRADDSGGGGGAFEDDDDEFGAPPPAPWGTPVPAGIAATDGYFA
jgi:SWI/SNF-related matrix-associated actin-dependent regulator of chromatin subfamily A member 5